MRIKNQKANYQENGTVWLLAVSALPWKTIKESESSYSVKKEKTKNTIKEINVLEDLKR